MEFQIFDAEYVQRLTAGDPATEAHFGTYFEKFLSLKLMSRRLDAAFAEDVRQETLFRVLKTLRQGSGVAQPERFGAFVNAVCNNVVLELRRKSPGSGDLPENAPEPRDERMDLHAALVTGERKRAVAATLDELSPKDRDILRLIFLEEWDRKQVCEKLGVEPEHLRVLLHRAKARFQSAYVRKHGLTTYALFLLCNVLILKRTIWWGM